MGNCQAAEAATVVIQHPKGKMERIYWSLSVNEVMSSNPGHHVAIVTAPDSVKSANATRVKQLKLLRPDDTLRIGNVYRLISFEEVLKGFGGKKYTKLSRLISIQKQGENGGEKKAGNESNGCDGPEPSQQENPPQVGQEEEASQSQVGRRGVGRHQRQWRPALQSIAEVGS